MKEPIHSNFLPWHLIVAMAFMLAACSSSEPTEVGQEKGGQTQIAAPLDLDVNNPNDFLPLVKEIILRDTMELLKALCHPDHSRILNSAAYTLCEIATEDMSRIDKCKLMFGSFVVDGEIEYNGDHAWIPLIYPSGDYAPLTLVLERIDEHWYLVGMKWDN